MLGDTETRWESLGTSGLSIKSHMCSVNIHGIAYMGEISSLSRGCGTPEFIKSPFGGVAKAEHPNRYAGRDHAASSKMLLPRTLRVSGVQKPPLTLGFLLDSARIHVTNFCVLCCGVFGERGALGKSF